MARGRTLARGIAAQLYERNSYNSRNNLYVKIIYSINIVIVVYIIYIIYIVYMVYTVAMMVTAWQGARV